MTAITRSAHKILIQSVTIEFALRNIYFKKVILKKGKKTTSDFSEIYAGLITSLPSE